MHIKSIVAGAAIALAATVGSAYAADQFTTLDGITATTMSVGELAVVRGQGNHDLQIHPSGGGSSSGAVQGSTFLDQTIVGGDASNTPSGLITATTETGGVVHFVPH